MPRVSVSGAFGSDTTSATFTAKAGAISVSGTFTATTTLQASVLGSTNWAPCTDPTTGDSIALTAPGVVTFNFEVPLLLRLSCDWTDGSVVYEATGANFS